MTLETLVAPAPGQDTRGELPGLFAAFAELTRRDLMATFGDDDLVDPPDVLAVAYAEQTRRRKALVLATEEGRVVGGGWFRMPLTDNVRVVEGNISIDPDADPARVLPAVWEGVRPIAAAEGRTTAMMWSSHSAVAGATDHLVPRTGVGRLPHDPMARAVGSLGFSLEQVERHSLVEVARALELAAAELPHAREMAGTAYRTHCWTGPTPHDQLEGMATLMARMSTDVPAGDLEIEPEIWDADRVADRDRVSAAMGRTVVTTVAEDVASGALVAYTILEVPQDKPWMAYQEDTLVHAEHRGHRLGMLVKALNLQQVAQHAPDLARIHTWNAGENDHMLAINEALGFRERTVEGAWQRIGL